MNTPRTVPHAAPHEPRIARIAAMIAEPTRARMLAYLLDGHCASAGELAEAGTVSPATASGHLSQLVDGGLLSVEARGRHRYFKLADAEVAQALMSLALVAERDTHTAQWQRPQRRKLRQARCCYGHLAGGLGVALYDRLRTIGAWSSDDARADLTAAGLAWLRGIGFDPERLTAPAHSKSRARLAYPCLDWSERRDHLAGTLGRALLQHFIASGWLHPHEGDRALTLTESGRRHLLPHLEPGSDHPDKG